MREDKALAVALKLLMLLRMKWAQPGMTVKGSPRVRLARGRSDGISCTRSRGKIKCFALQNQKK